MRWLGFAFSNVRRNRRRSLVSVGIAALCTASVLVASGFALYTYESLAQAAARTTGHLILGTPAQFAEDEETPLEHGLDRFEALAAAVLADPAVRAVLPSISFGGLASNGSKSVVMLGLGVDPRAEFTVKGPFLKLVAGDVLSGRTGGMEVMLGQGLAQSLRVAPGDSLTLLATTTQGALNAIDVTVSGVFTVGVPEIDKRFAYLDLASAQALLRSDRVSAIGVFLGKIEETESAKQRLARKFPELAIRTWSDEAVFHNSVKQLYNRIFGALGLIISIIVVVVTANTMAMAIIERTRELSTLRAIGTHPSQLVLTLTLEGLLLGLGGALLGALLAAAASLFFVFVPVEMPPPPGRSMGYPLHLAFDSSVYALVAACITAMSALAAWFVARRTMAMPITDGLAHN